MKLYGYVPVFITKERITEMRLRKKNVRHVAACAVATGGGGRETSVLRKLSGYSSQKMRRAPCFVSISCKGSKDALECSDITTGEARA